MSGTARVIGAGHIVDVTGQMLGDLNSVTSQALATWEGLLSDFGIQVNTLTFYRISLLEIYLQKQKSPRFRGLYIRRFSLKNWQWGLDLNQRNPGRQGKGSWDYVEKQVKILSNYFFLLVLKSQFRNNNGGMIVVNRLIVTRAA